MRFSMRFCVPRGVRECLLSGAPMSPALVCRSIKAMVRSCQCSSKVAISLSKSGPRVDAGLTREVENGKRSLGTRGNLLSGCRNDDRIRACRATNAARHAGIGVPTHHKRTVTLRPPHEHRGGRALAGAGFELRSGGRGRGGGGGVVRPSSSRPAGMPGLARICGA
jgi:hypothetical protein